MIKRWDIKQTSHLTYWNYCQEFDRIESTNTTERCTYHMTFGLYICSTGSIFSCFDFFFSNRKLGQRFKYKSISLPIKICHFGKQKHREQSANVTAFSGTGLADFAKVAQTQVLCSHTLSLPHTEHKSDVIEQAGIIESWGGVRVKVVESAMGTKS